MSENEKEKPSPGEEEMKPQPETVSLDEGPEEIPEEELPPPPKKSPFRRLKFLILLLLIGGILALMWSVVKFDLLNLKDKKIWEKIPFLTKKPTEQKKEEAPQVLPRVKVYKVAKQDFQDILHSIGTIQGISKTLLKFETNGVVKTFNFREGDLVRRGEVLAELEHYDSELKVKFREEKITGAKTGVQAAKQKLDTHQRLFDIGAIIKDKVDEVKLEVQKAESELRGAEIEMESAKSELEKTYLLAPLDGVLGSKDVEPGEFITSNAKVATIVDIKAVYVEVGIIEKDLDKIEPGQKVSAKVDTYPDQDFFGEIENIAPTVGGSRTLAVKARIQNPESLLLPGMFARVKITVFEKADTIVLPKVAVNSTGKDFTSFVIDKDNKALLRPLEVGHMSPDYAQVDSGISAGEQVVIESQAPLKEGAQVEIVEVQETL